MKMQDSQIRAALIAVLDTFGVGYEDINVSGNPQLEFRLADKKFRFSYSSEAPDADSVVRRLANLLEANNLSPLPETPKPAERPTYPPLTTPQPVIDETMAEALGTEKDSAPIPTARDEKAEPPAAQPKAPAATEKPPTPQGLYVYRPKPDYVPADVFVIEAVKDIVLPVGHRLIIPVHDPSRMFVLEPEDFLDRYVAASFRPPYQAPQATSPAVVPPAPVQPITPKPVQPERASKRKPIPSLPPQPDYLPKLGEQPLFRRTGPAPQPKQSPVPEVEPEPVAKRPAPYKPPREVEPEPVAKRPAPAAKPAERAVEPEPQQPPPPKKVIKVSTESVPGQVGRIMTGIYQAIRVSGQREVSASDAGEYMMPGDRKQISARLPPYVEAGWLVVRKEGWGLRYSLTSVGVDIVRKFARASYENYDYEVPPFVKNIS